MAAALKCDRCGGFYVPKNMYLTDEKEFHGYYISGFHYNVVSKNGIQYVHDEDVDVDLCCSCVKKLLDFMNMEGE